MWVVGRRPALGALACSCLDQAGAALQDGENGRVVGRVVLKPEGLAGSGYCAKAGPARARPAPPNPQSCFGNRSVMAYFVNDVTATTAGAGQALNAAAGLPIGR